MTYQVRAAIEATRRLLYGTSRPIRNQLATTVDNSTTTVVCAYPTTNLPTRSLVSIGLETMFVWDKNDGTKTLTVTRGELGSDAATHTSGDMIEVNARFSRPAINQAIQDEIRSWEPDLFRVVDVGLSTGTFPSLVDLGEENGEAYHILSARYSRTESGGTQWIDLQGSNLIRGLDSATYPAGVAISVNPPAGWATGSSSVSSFRVALAMPFDLEFESESTDLVEDVGLARSMCDLAVWGAAVRLLASAEVSRTDPTAQGQARDATQVRVGDQTQVAASLQRKFNDRFSQEVAKLQRRYPIRY